MNRRLDDLPNRGRLLSLFFSLLLVLSMCAALDLYAAPQGGHHQRGPYRARVQGEIQKKYERKLSAHEQNEIRRKQAEKSRAREELERKQARELILQQLKDDLNRLIALAQSLQEELGRAGPNEVPVNMLASANEIERLAKQIKKAAKGSR